MNMGLRQACWLVSPFHPPKFCYAKLKRVYYLLPFIRPARWTIFWTNNKKAAPRFGLGAALEFLKLVVRYMRLKWIEKRALYFAGIFRVPTAIHNAPVNTVDASLSLEKLAARAPRRRAGIERGIFFRECEHIGRDDSFQRKALK